jgi:Zn-dependent M16 (insulinase) family peptidase
MLSSGTNAYTSEDHTCYEITAGEKGMINVFPVFLDHILNPTFSLDQFKTEVFHIDSTGKKQGVVYCEMASRENTEADLLDLNLRQLIYNQHTTYSFECGGKTCDISLLDNQEIIEFHKQFYHIENITAILCEKVEKMSVEKLDIYP